MAFKSNARNANRPRPPKPRFKKGDQVQVIAGKAKGQSGEVLKMDLKRDVVLIKGVNMRLRHSKPRRQGEQGGILSMEGPVHVSKVLAHCPTCSKAVRKLCTDSKACKYNQ
jgi:large subunit ribosomal protein L24